MKLIDDIKTIDANVLEFIAYNFYIEKLGLNWEKFNTVEDYIAAKLNNNILGGRVPALTRITLNLTTKKIVSYYLSNRWEYDGVYMERQRIISYERSRIFYHTSNCSSCGECGSVDSENLEQYMAQIRFITCDPETLKPLSKTKCIDPNLSIKMDYKTDKEIEIKKYYGGMFELPEAILDQIPKDVLEVFQLHNVWTYTASGETFLEIYL